MKAIVSQRGASVEIYSQRKKSYVNETVRIERFDKASIAFGSPLWADNRTQLVGENPEPPLKIALEKED